MSEEIKRSEEEFSFQCPSCTNGIIQINKSIYDLPDGDKMLILNFICDKCNFSKNDIIPLSTKREPGVMILKVTDEADLKSKIYRSPTGKLEIPEFELIVEPGPSADFYYTNVEGILDRFQNAVSIYKNNLDNEDIQKIEVEKILENLHEAMEGQFPFTLKIIDSIGGSYIIPIDKSKFVFEKIDYNENDQE